MTDIIEEKALNRIADLLEELVDLKKKEVQFQERKAKAIEGIEKKE